MTLPISPTINTQPVYRIPPILSSNDTYESLLSRWRDDGIGEERTDRITVYNEIIEQINSKNKACLKICSNFITEIPPIPDCIEELKIHECHNLEEIIIPDNLKYLTTLNIENCNKLRKISSCGDSLSQLNLLVLFRCNSLTNLPAFSNYLEFLTISSVPELVRLPDLSNCLALKSIYLYDCNSLSEWPILPNRSGNLSITGSNKLPDEFTIFKCWSLKGKMIKERKIVMNEKLAKIDQPIRGELEVHRLEKHIKLIDSLKKLKFIEKCREVIADRSHNHMIEHGSLWKNQKITQKEEYINELSTANITELNKLELSKLEQSFLARFRNIPLFVTHYTDENIKNERGVVSIFSRKKLIQLNKSFSRNHSTEYDINNIGNDDFVFFSLEAGMSPKKPESRFGEKMYRFSFDDLPFNSTWLSLVDMALKKDIISEEKLKGLGVEKDEIDKIKQDKKMDETELLKTVFSGKDMKDGIALSIINTIRTKLSTASQETVLSRSINDDTYMNMLINGFYRPEVKVARQFFSCNYTEIIPFDILGQRV